MKHFRRIALVLSIVFITQNIFGQGWTVTPADYTYDGDVVAVVFHGLNEVTTGTLGAFVGTTCRGFANGAVFPLTGRTVFTVRCYSNQASGETLTFRYYDPGDGSFYDIKETVGFVSNMTGDASSPLEFHTVPLVFAVTGGTGSYCQGGSGLPVGLDGSESGVTYTLLKNGSPQIPTISGTGSSISFGNQLAGTYTVTGTNSGGTTSMTGSAVISEIVTPPPTGSASQSFCTGATVGNLVAVGTAIQWYSVSSGGSPLGLSTVLINGTHYYASQTISACESQLRLNVTATVSPIPATPGTISGTASQCSGLTGQIYSISAVPNATTYTWTVPGGWSVTAGAGSTSITVTTGSAGQNGNISVTAGNGCGTSSPGTLAVTVNPAAPATPGTISGTSAQCSGLTGQTYSISAVANATIYNWTVPSGWSVTGGAGTTSITVTTGSAGQNGSINVTAGNSCGTSSPSTLAVTVTAAPATPGTISGTSVQCAGLTGQVYSISAVANATTYTWTVPGGWSVIGGAGTTSITVTTGSAGQNGNISVTAGNGCGTSSPRTLAVSVNPGAPATPGAISGIATQCPGLAGQTYSISAVANASSYTWTVPSGWNVTAGAGTTSITVTTGSAGQNGNITVTASNGCGTSLPGSLSVTVTALPAAPSTVLIQPTCAVSTGTITVTAPTGSGMTYSIDGSNYTNSTGIFVSVAPGTYNVTAKSAAGCLSSGSIVTINAQPPTPVVSNQTASISSGAIFTVTPGGVPVGTTYSWPVPTYTNGVTGGVAQSAQANISGTLTIPSGVGTAIYTVTPTAGSCTGANFLVTVTVTSTCVAVTIGTQPISTGMCATTGSASFTVVANGTAPYTYQWQYNNSGTWAAVVNGTPAGASYTNSTTPILNVAGITSAGSPQYHCFVTNCTGGNSATSNAVTLTVNALPVPTLISSDADNIFCLGTSVTFTAGGGGVGANYDFRVSGTTLQTGPSTTYTTTSLANAQIVTVVVTNASLCSATSAGIANFVNQPPNIYISTPAACSTDYLTYSVGVTVGSGTVTCNVPTAVVTNTGVNIWTISGVLAGVNVIITVTDINGCQNSITVTAPNCLCPVVLAPVSGGNKSYCVGGVIPALTATVLTGETVDWYDSSSGGNLLRFGSLSYTPTGPGTYYALARNTTSNCVSSTRTAVTLTMNPLPTPSLTSSDPDNIFCAGTSVTFTGSGGTNYNFFVGGTSQQNGASATYTTSTLTNGQAVNVIVTNAAGCTATSASITNTVNPTPTPTLTSSDADNIFCAGTSVTFTSSGGATYNFRVNGVSVQNTASATYTTSSLTNGQVVSVVVSNANGCSATSANITNTVNPVPAPTLTSSDADNIFCAGTSVTFTAGGGTTYNFRVGGVSVQNSAVTTYTTSSLTNGQIVDVIVSNSIGCAITSAGITNTVNPQPVTNAGTGGTVCDLSFRFSAVPSIGIGTWTKTTGLGTATFAPNPNTPNATVTVSEYGTYTFTWTEVSGQCSGNSIVTVNFNLQPVANAGTGGNNCGLGFRFNASLNIGTGTWAKVSGPGNVTFTPDGNTANALVTVTSFGTYTFSWTVVNGTCSNSSNVIVAFIQQSPANAGSGGNECDMDFNLNAVVTTTGTGTWTKASGPGNAVFTPDNHQPNAKVTVDKFGAYTFAWTVVNSTCSSSDIVNVVFHDLPSINAGRDTAICKGGTVQLQATGAGTVSWIPALLVNNPNVINPVATPDTTTTFTVNLTDQFGCKNSDNIVVEVREKPVADAGPDQELGYQFTTSMDAKLAHSYEKGIWSVLEGTGDFSDSTYTNSSVQSLSLGINKFLWIVSNGFCSSSGDTVMISVTDFIIPTLITPNMDGRNDYFVLRGLTTLGKTELIIFDRRGAQVFRNMNYDNTWNGVDYNNNPLPDDTYFFVLKTASGKSISGYIVIRR